MKIIISTFFLLFVYLGCYAQSTDPLNENNKISSFNISTGISKVHYSNYIGEYDSIPYLIDNAYKGINFGVGYSTSLYFALKNEMKFLLSYGGEVTSRKFKIYYNTDELLVNEIFFNPCVSFGLRSKIHHNLWIIDSYKAFEVKLNFGAPILLLQNTIIDHSRLKSTNSIYVKYHFGLEVKFSSLQSNGKGHQFGTELYLENSKQDIPNTIPFKTPYYLGIKLFYCILNKAK